MPSMQENASIDDLSTLQSLPDSYTWTTNDEHLPTSATAATAGGKESILVVNLADADVTLIGHACKTWGAFQVVNHDVPSRLLDDIEFLAGSLFRLPSQRKLQTASSGDSLAGYGAARISPFFNKKMWSEGFTVGDDSFYDQFQKLWPDDHVKYCDIIEDYKEEMQKLAWKLMRLMLSSLAVTEEDIKWAGPNNSGFLRLNHYPVCPEPDRAMGLAAHTDSTLLTILYQSNTAAGLQMFKEGSGWVTVRPIPGSFVVNVGDLFHILSNGKLASALHQVRVNQTSSRLSVAYLWGTPANIEVSPIPKLVCPVEPLLYRPVTWKEYLEIKAKYFNKALSMVRVDALTSGPFSNDTDVIVDQI